MEGRELSAVVAELESLLAREGVPAVIAHLNARTRYRYTGVYRVDPPYLRNVHLHDRENPKLRLSGDINTLRDTYCAITAAGGVPFAIDDAAVDARLAGHAARCTVLSYLGVPIRAADGGAWGTLCHFDARPRVTPSGELPVLEWAASAIAGRLACAAAASRV